RTRSRRELPPLCRLYPLRLQFLCLGLKSATSALRLLEWPVTSTVIRPPNCTSLESRAPMERRLQRIWSSPFSNQRICPPPHLARSNIGAQDSLSQRNGQQR